MKEAFTYMFKDNKFWVKGLCYLGFVFIANLLLNYAQTLLPPCPKCAPPLPWNYWVCFILGTILNLIPLGYMFTCIKAIIDQEETPVLPFINPLKDLLKGLKYSVAILIFLLPLLVVTMLIIFGITTLALGSAIGLVISKIFLISVILFVALIIIGFNWIFANKDSLINFYRFKKVFEIIGAGKKKYFGHVGMVFLMFILNMLLEMGFGYTAGLLGIGTIPGLFVVGILAAITGTYTVFVICHLTANSVKRELAETV